MITSIKKRLTKGAVELAVAENIASLDLDPIKVKLMDPEEGEGWSRETADTVEVHYRVFLDLNRKYPSRSIVPNGPVDTFWHYHILDTLKYADDCSRVFGYFLHHFPYFGMRGDEDRRQLERAYSETKALIGETYGSLPPLVGIGARIDQASVCDSTPNCYGASCNGTRCGGEASALGGMRPTLWLGGTLD